MRAARDAVDASTEPTIAADLDLAQAKIDNWFTLYKASYRMAKWALERFRELEDPVRCAAAQKLFGHALVFLGRIPDGERRLEESLATFRFEGALKSAGYALQSLGLASVALGDFAEAWTRFGDALGRQS